MINYSLVKRYAKVGDETSVKLTYGTAQTVKTIDLMEFAKHIADHARWQNNFAFHPRFTNFFDFGNIRQICCGFNINFFAII